ncbi:DUF3592 domain-containing protein [Luteolibacter luteus]|uniref:DUF3592 domain-containing protein n=1 Tax=Luteolibacter luteus TaxID=2728835 RepID=A0A858REC7_9BACT|nr:DUF3592 domain-containing protein [Luteolibacter luteus]QJE94914.1 DUF3592 domain-containing protein [Luteolibacter luteus]
MESYQLALLCVIVLLVTAKTAFWFQSHEDRKRLEQQAWPVVEGLILEARITESDSSSMSSFSTTISAAGLVSYPHPTGEATAAFYLQSSSLPARNWSENFNPGSRPALRYNPENPKELSFIDFLGTP